MAASGEPTEHLEVTQDGQAALPGPAEFGVFRRYGVAMDDQLGFGRQMRGGMAREHAHFFGGQFPNGGGIAVGPAELPSPIRQHVAERPHPAAPRSHQVRPP